VTREDAIQSLCHYYAVFVDSVKAKLSYSSLTLDCDLHPKGLVIIPVLVTCALDFDLRNSLSIGVMFFVKRASASQISRRGVLWRRPAALSSWGER
jgi:hypothetical protein